MELRCWAKVSRSSVLGFMFMYKSCHRQRARYCAVEWVTPIDGGGIAGAPVSDRGSVLNPACIFGLFRVVSPMRLSP